MTDLIDALEAAGGPSRELDVAIAVLVDYRPNNLVNGQTLRKARVQFPKDISGAARHFEIPYYTSSLDAALSLIPDRCDYIKFVSDPSGSGWELGEFHLGTEENYVALGEGVTPGDFALALCIAALRAMEASDG